MNSSGVFFFFPRWWYGVGYCQVFFGWFEALGGNLLTIPTLKLRWVTDFGVHPVMSCNPIIYATPSLSSSSSSLSLYFFLVPTFKYSFLSSKFHSSFDLLLEASFLSFFFCCFFPPYNSSLLRQKDRERGRQIRRFSSFFSLRGNWAVTVSFFCFVWQSQ